MKRRMIILATCITMSLSFAGCDTVDALANEIVENTDTPVRDDISTYIYSGEVQFIPISYQNIDDGTFNGIDIMKFVDLNTGAMYLYTSKFQSGYGTTWEVLIDTDGSPLIYESLDELRSKYGWSE